MYASLWICTHECSCPRTSEEGVRSSGTRATSGNLKHREKESKGKSFPFAQTRTRTGHCLVVGDTAVNMKVFFF